MRGYNSVLAAIDLNHADSAAGMLRYLLDHFEPSVELHLAHVMAIPGDDYVARLLPPETLKDAADTMRAHMQRIIASAEAQDRVKPHLLRGGISEQIVALAEQLEVGLVLLNAHRPSAQFTTLGSNANQIVRRAPCAVLVRR